MPVVVEHLVQNAKDCYEYRMTVAGHLEKENKLGKIYFLEEERSQHLDKEGNQRLGGRESALSREKVDYKGQRHRICDASRSIS